VDVRGGVNALSTECEGHERGMKNMFMTRIVCRNQCCSFESSESGQCMTRNKDSKKVTQEDETGFFTSFNDFPLAAPHQKVRIAFAKVFEHVQHIVNDLYQLRQVFAGGKVRLVAKQKREFSR
jgi:hypothetical protein